MVPRHSRELPAGRVHAFPQRRPISTARVKEKDAQLCSEPLRGRVFELQNLPAVEVRLNIRLDFLRTREQPPRFTSHLYLPLAGDQFAYT